MKIVIFQIRVQDLQLKFEAVYLTPFFNSLKNGLGREEIMKRSINGRKKLAL